MSHAANRGLRRWLVTIGLSLVLAGCGLFSGLRVDAVATSYQKPSNVAVYLSISDRKGQVPTLSATDFVISEDGQALPAGQTKQTLLDRDLIAAHHTLLLLDMSGSLDAATKSELARGAARLAAAVSGSQGVTVAAFDGSEQLSALDDFEKGATVPNTLGSVSSFEPKDPSSNLYGAVIEGVNLLGARLTAVKKPVRVGTLVVVARSGDLAGRATLDDMIVAIEDSGYRSVAVGLGEDFGSMRLDDIGHDHEIEVPAVTSLGEAIAQAGAKAHEFYQSHYLLSYCSPARAGMRQVDVQVVVTDAEGKERRARTRTSFDATGFGSGCDPTLPPTFVAVAEPPAPEGEEGTEEEEGIEESPTPAPAPPTSQPTSPAPKKPAPPPDGDGIVPPPASPDYAPE